MIVFSQHTAGDGLSGAKAEGRRKEESEIIGIKENDRTTACSESAWDDRVAKGPWYSLGMDDYEERQRRCFKADPKDIQDLRQ